MRASDFVERFLPNGFLFHFTDRRNLPSIRAEGGLLSLELLRRRGIVPVAAGGNDWSHDADEKLGLHRYVHLCFLDQHPMEYIAKNDGRIVESAFLKIESRVVVQEGVLASLDVSNKANVKVQPFENGIEQMDLEVMFARTDWKNREIQQRRNTAKKYEVLIPSQISREFIRGLE